MEHSYKILAATFLLLLFSDNSTFMRNELDSFVHRFNFNKENSAKLKNRKPFKIFYYTYTSRVFRKNTHTHTPQKCRNFIGKSGKFICHGKIPMPFLLTIIVLFYIIVVLFSHNYKSHRVLYSHELHTLSLFASKRETAFHFVEKP